MAVTFESSDEKTAETENSAHVVWALAWPAVALNSMAVVNTLLDRFFIGHLPSSALTAHGAAINIMFLMFSLAMSLATGATALVSRAWGAQDEPEFRKSGQESLNLAVILGLVFGLVSAAIAGGTAHALLPKNDLEAQTQMIRFIVAYSAGLPAIFVIQTLAGSLRGVGDTKSPMVISGIQIAFHITLNFLLVLPKPGLGWGLLGAAVALSASAWISAVLYLAYMHRTPLGIPKLLQWPDLHWAQRILKVALPAAAMACLRVFSLTAFTLVLKQVPDASAAIAAMGVGFAIESIMFMPAFGLSVAASALVGQSLGMKRPERAERLAWTAGHYAAGVTLAIAVPIYFLAPLIASTLLQNKPEVVAQAIALIRCLAVTEVLFGYAMVMIGAMQGAGDTVRPLWISVFSLWGLRVPLAMVLALPKAFMIGGWFIFPSLGFGALGAWTAMSFTQALQGILALLAFRQGHWKTQKV